MAARPRIRMLAVGGTISTVPTPGSAGVMPVLTAAEIVEAVPQLGEMAELELGDFSTIASFAVTPGDMLLLAREVVRALEDGCDGVLLTHGTDSIEETAYALALMVPRGTPVVLTGAMRGPSLPGTEGPANLVSALAVASNGIAGDLGPVVVMNDEVHPARFVAKSHSTRASTFVSAGSGPIGETVEGRAHLWLRPLWEDYLGLPESLDGIEVELVKMVTGVSDVLLRAAIERKPAAIAIDGFGGGHVPPPLVPLLADAIADGLPVVIASRSLAGRTLAGTYGMPGAELDLAEKGVIAAGHLSAHKARLRLMVGLALGLEPRSLFPVS